jgi:hypothetical protein
MSTLILISEGCKRVDTDTVSVTSCHSGQNVISVGYSGLGLLLRFGYEVFSKKAHILEGWTPAGGTVLGGLETSGGGT